MEAKRAYWLVDAGPHQKALANRFIKDYKGKYLTIPIKYLSNTSQALMIMHMEWKHLKKLTRKDIHEQGREFIPLQRHGPRLFLKI